MKRILSILLLLVGITSCSDDNTINRVVEPATEVTIPQGGDAKADAMVEKLFERYDTYFLYDFTEKDLDWRLVSGGMFDTQYRHTPIRPSDVPNLLTALQEAWLDFYPEDFCRRHLPRFVYLAEKLESGELSYSYSEGAFVTRWKSISSRYLEHQMAVANVGGAWSDMPAEERQAFKNSLQSTMLTYCVSTHAIQIPESFYAVSTYGGSSLSVSRARDAGFIPNPLTGQDWATTSTSLSREDDLDAYLCAIACHTPAQWRTLYSGKSKIKQKYDILVATLTDYGIDVAAIGNFK